MSIPLDIRAVNALSETDFVAEFGSIYEYTPQVATVAFLNLPFRDRNHLIKIMAKVVAGFDPDEQLTLILKHPRLGKRGDLTASSRGEQASAGLDNLAQTKTAELAQLNDEYFERFQFPFIIAVKLLQGRDVHEVIKLRLQNDLETEFTTALEEIDKIASLRVELLVTT